jgi:hypothetical protein
MDHTMFFEDLQRELHLIEQLASAVGTAAIQLPPVFLWLLAIPELSSLLGP